MKSLQRLIVLAVLCTALFAPTLSAATVRYHAMLTGDQEVPPRETTGSGEVHLWFDPSDSSWLLTGWFKDLVSDSMAAHIHGPASPMENAGVLYPLMIDTGVRSGSISGSGYLTPAQVGYLMDGLLYVNLHSQMYMPGEIRGQLQSVPDTAGSGLALAAALGLAAVIKRRSRARG